MPQQLVEHLADVDAGIAEHIGIVAAAEQVEDDVQRIADVLLRLPGVLTGGGCPEQLRLPDGVPASEQQVAGYMVIIGGPNHKVQPRPRMPFS